MRVSPLIAVCLFLTGCATARLSGGPESFAPIQYSGAINIGVAKVIDGRQTPKMGTIGATSVRVKQADLAAITTNYLINTLNTDLKANVTRVSEIRDNNASSVTSVSQADVFLATKINKVKMFSADAILQPVEVTLDMDLTVFDKSGKAIYTTSCIGNYEKRIGISLVDKSTGLLVESAIKDAMSHLVKNEEFRKALGV